MEILLFVGTDFLQELYRKYIIYKDYSKIRLIKTRCKIMQNIHGIEYSKPEVVLLQDTGIGVSETAARTCYDSFASSENGVINDIQERMPDTTMCEEINSIEESNLLGDLAWTYFHHSILEHANLSFLIRGTSRACFSADTEVMTNAGFKLFSDLTKEDMIATRNTRGEVVYQKPTAYHEYDKDEKLHRYKSNSVDLLVTRDHKMLFKKSKNIVRTKEARREVHLVASEDIDVSSINFFKKFNSTEKGLPKITTINGDTYLKKNSNNTRRKIVIPSLQINTKSYLVLLAIYISDGNVIYCEKENKYTIVITDELKNHKDIIASFKKCGVHAHSNGKLKVRANSREFGRHFKALGFSLEKQIPFNEMEMSKKDALIFLNKYLQHDGYINLRTKQGMIYTSSYKLANQLFNIALIAGYTPNMHEDNRAGEKRYIKGIKCEVNYINYQISISFIGKQNIEPTIKIKKHRSEEHYVGKVYCVSVPNATLFVRRKGTGNAVWCGNCLQEHARHRIQAISVRSTRYTMSSIINAFVASGGKREFFIGKILDFNMFVTQNKRYNRIEISAMFDKLAYQQEVVEDFRDISVAKSSFGFLEEFKGDSQALFDALEAGKKKRNVGDAFKHIIGDNVKVDMVVTFNLRSLKNYFTLRDSGAAYFQIRWLAQEMMRVTPSKYLDLIVKGR